jgi:hypothetical protein
MSLVIEDVGRAFEGFTRNIFTVLALIAGIAVLSFALPYIIKLVGTITSLAGGGAQISSSLYNYSAQTVR